MGRQKGLSEINYLISGSQGAGKGTQAEILAKKIKGRTIIVGDLVRQKAQKSSQIAQRINAGHLLKAEQILQLIEASLRKIKKGPLVFDGASRTLKQAKGLDLICQKLNIKKPLTIFLKISNKTALDRLTKRRVCSKCKQVFYYQDPNYKKGICPKCGQKLVQRADDQPEAIKVRLKHFAHKIKPILNYYQKNNRLIIVNGEPSIDKVAQEAERKINDYFEKSRRNKKNG